MLPYIRKWTIKSVLVYPIFGKVSNGNSDKIATNINNAESNHHWSLIKVGNKWFLTHDSCVIIRTKKACYFTFICQFDLYHPACAIRISVD